MARKQVVFVAFILLFGFVFSEEEEKDPACRSCGSSIKQTLSFLASAIKGMEPMSKHNESICRLVEVRGISTIAYNNKSCIKDCGEPGKEGPCYYQMIELRFDKIKIGCQLHQSPADTVRIVAEESAKLAANTATNLGNVAMDAGKDAMGGLTSGAAKIPGFGKRDAEESKEEGDYYTFFVNGSWSALIIHIEMKLCFDDDIYNITNVKIMDEFYNGLELWCEGGRLIADVCGLITRPVFVRWLFGWVVSFFAKGSIADGLMDPSVSDYITSLNCGDDD